MLLHRVIEHFKKQQWTAIVIDFVIVVAGVFVEIQDAYWRGCYRVVDGQESYGFDCRTEAAENISAETVRAIVSNPDIVPTLTEWAGFVRATPQTLVDQNLAGERAIAAINEALGDRR